MSQDLAKNTAFMTAASVGQKLIAFVYFLLLARIMMPEKTGVFFLATSIITMFSVLTDLGISSIIVREIAKTPERTKFIVKEVVGVKSILIVFALICVFAASILLHYDDQTTVLIWITSIVMIFDALALLCYGILRGSQLLKYEAMGIVLGQFVTVIVGAFFLFIHPDVRFLVLALICGSITNLILAAVRVIKEYGWDIFIPEWNKSKIRHLIKVMIPFALAGIFTKIFSSVDVVLISKIMSTTSVGIYSIAYKFTYAFQFLPLAFSAALYPSLSSALTKDYQVTANTFRRALWYIFLISTPIVFGIWLIAPEMVKLLGHGYVESTQILRVLIFVLFPSFLEIPFGALLNASNKQSSRMTVLGVAMLTNVLCDIVFIPKFGLYGAVLGSLIGYSFMICIEFILVMQFLPSFFTKQFVYQTSATILSGVGMLWAGILLKPLIHWIFVIPCVAIVYSLLLFVTKSVTKSDLNGLRSSFKTPESLV